jgi:hypothetical protein
MRARALVAAGLVALAAGCGTGSPDNAPGRGLKEDDQRWAEGALPTDAAVPDGWDVGADDRGAALDDCDAIDLSDLELTGEAVATYSSGEVLLALAGTQVFPTAEDAATAVTRGDDAVWEACLEEEVREAFESDDEGLVALRATASEPPDVGDDVRTARVTGMYVAGDRQLDATIDVVRLRRDRGVFTLVAAGLGEEFPPEVIRALVRDFDARAAAKPPPPA